MKRIFLLLIAFSHPFCILPSCQAQQAEVGFDDLEALIGSGLEDGMGVTSAQVESPSQNADGSLAYMPNSASSQFSNTIFFDATGTNSGSIAHASNVGFRMYGRLGMANGLGRAANPINSYEVNDFLNSILLNGGGDPASFDINIANHSYIFYQDAQNFSDDLTISLLRRFDFVADQNETSMFVGVNNGSASALPEFFSNSYNSISVGRSDGGHSFGPTTSVYGPGRTKPDIVAPDTRTSFSTPMVSAAAAILHEAGTGTDANKTETIRALLLAGATKDEFPTWDRTVTRPIDDRFGAGELNIYNSYMSLQGGEFNGTAGDPAAPVALNGWDYETEIVSGNDLFYEFEVSNGTKLDELSIVLCWNMEINDLNNSPSIFSSSENLGDLNLDFYDSSGSFLGSLLDESKSSVDNVEHIYLQDLPEGTYHLKVSSDTNRDFGLAWRSTSSNLLLGDVNQDGTVSFLDLAPFITLLLTGNYQFQADTNGDGQLNFFDIAGFLSLLT